MFVTARHDQAVFAGVKREKKFHEATAALGRFGSVQFFHSGLLDPPDQKWFMPWTRIHWPIRHPCASR